MTTFDSKAEDWHGHNMMSLVTLHVKNVLFYLRHAHKKKRQRLMSNRKHQQEKNWRCACANNVSLVLVSLFHRDIYALSWQNWNECYLVDALWILHIWTLRGLDELNFLGRWLTMRYLAILWKGRLRGCEFSIELIKLAEHYLRCLLIIEPKMRFSFRVWYFSFMLL